jgi:hypothetical protein
MWPVTVTDSMSEFHSLLSTTLPVTPGMDHICSRQSPDGVQRCVAGNKKSPPVGRLLLALRVRAYARTLPTATRFSRPRSSTKRIMTRAIRTEFSACNIMLFGPPEPHPHPAELGFYTTLRNICQIAIIDRESVMEKMENGDLTRFDFCGNLAPVTDEDSNEMKRVCLIAVKSLEPRRREEPVDPFG